MSSRRKPLFTAMVAMSTVPLVTALGVATAGSAQADATCTANVGNTGLSAALVATPHQTIARGTLDATGCDIGIYIGQGVRHVTVRSMTVTGANFQGIFAEKTSYVRIFHSTITGNALNTIDPTAPPLPGSGVQSRVGQAFAISLFGVSHATVRNNDVYDNGRGGIGVMDNGPNDPGAMADHQDPAAPLVASTHDVVIGNRTWANYNGCGVVAATQNFDGHLGDITIARNTISGTGFGAAGPDIGGIVVAADLPGSTVVDATVRGNTVRDSFEGGLIVNAEAPGSSTRHVRLFHNTVSGNNVGHLEVDNTAGVITNAADGAANIGTTVFGNRISDQFYGIWTKGDFPPRHWHNDIEVTDGGVPVSLN
jgi:hypothetical protein